LLKGASVQRCDKIFPDSLGLSIIITYASFQTELLRNMLAAEWNMGEYPPAVI
jgi:hypothetical protein